MKFKKKPTRPQAISKKLTLLSILIITIFLIFSLFNLSATGTGIFSLFTSSPSINVASGQQCIMRPNPRGSGTIEICSPSAPVKSGSTSTSTSSITLYAPKDKSNDDDEPVVVAKTTVVKNTTNTGTSTTITSQSGLNTSNPTTTQTVKKDGAIVSSDHPTFVKALSGNTPLGDLSKVANTNNGNPSGGSVVEGKFCPTNGSPVLVGTWVPTGDANNDIREGIAGRVCVKCGENGYEGKQDCRDVIASGQPIVLPSGGGQNYTGSNSPMSSCFAKEGGAFIQVPIGKTIGDSTCSPSGNMIDVKNPSQEEQKKLNEYCGLRQGQIWADGKCQNPLTARELDERKKAIESQELADKKQACEVTGVDRFLSNGRCVSIAEVEHTQQDCINKGLAYNKDTNNCSATKLECVPGLTARGNYTTCDSTTNRIVLHTCPAGDSSKEYVVGVGCVPAGNPVNSRGTLTGGELINSNETFKCKYGSSFSTLHSSNICLFADKTATPPGSSPVDTGRTLQRVNFGTTPQVPVSNNAPPTGSTPVLVETGEIPTANNIGQSCGSGWWAIGCSNKCGGVYTQIKVPLSGTQAPYYTHYCGTPEDVEKLNLSTEYVVTKEINNPPKNNTQNDVPTYFAHPQGENAGWGRLQADGKKINQLNLTTGQWVTLKECQSNAVYNSGSPYCPEDVTKNNTIESGGLCSAGGSSACQSNDCRRALKPGTDKVDWYCMASTNLSTQSYVDQNSNLKGANGSNCFGQHTNCASGFCGKYLLLDKCMDNPF